jgi:hypothetical protein
MARSIPHLAMQFQVVGGGEAPRSEILNCDCSFIAGRLHLGVCIAGIRTCRLFGSSVDTKFPQHTVAGEIQTLEFAIHCVERFIKM